MAEDDEREINNPHGERADHGNMRRFKTNVRTLLGEEVEDGNVEICVSSFEMKAKRQSNLGDVLNPFQQHQQALDNGAVLNIGRPIDGVTYVLKDWHKLTKTNAQGERLIYEEPTMSFNASTVVENTHVRMYLALLFVTLIFNLTFMSLLTELNPDSDGSRWRIDWGLVFVYAVSICSWTVAHIVEITMTHHTFLTTKYDGFLMALCLVVSILLMYPWTLVIQPSLIGEQGDYGIIYKGLIIAVNTLYLAVMMQHSHIVINNFKRFLRRTLSSAKDKMFIENGHFSIYAYAEELNYKYDVATIAQYKSFFMSCKFYLLVTFIMLGVIFVFCAVYIAVLTSLYEIMGVLEISYTTTLMVQFLIKLNQIKVWNEAVAVFENDRKIDLELKLNVLGLDLPLEHYTAYVVYAATYVAKLVSGSKSG